MAKLEDLITQNSVDQLKARKKVIDMELAKKKEHSDKIAERIIKYEDILKAKKGK